MWCSNLVFGEDSAVDVGRPQGVLVDSSIQIKPRPGQSLAVSRHHKFEHLDQQFKMQTNMQDDFALVTHTNALN